MTIVTAKQANLNNWWPVSDEEWERLNFPERFKKSSI
jgi:hypothetical protein